MTREETVEYAIKFFNRRLREPVLQYGERQALHIAISALREQEKLARNLHETRTALKRLVSIATEAENAFL